MSNAQIAFSIALGVVSLVIFAFATYVMTTVARNTKSPKGHVVKADPATDLGAPSHGNLIGDKNS